MKNNFCNVNVIFSSFYFMFDKHLLLPLAVIDENRRRLGRKNYCIEHGWDYTLVGIDELRVY